MGIFWRVLVRIMTRTLNVLVQRSFTAPAIDTSTRGSKQPQHSATRPSLASPPESASNSSNPVGLPPADWLARRTAGGPPAHWLALFDESNAQPQWFDYDQESGLEVSEHPQPRAKDSVLSDITALVPPGLSDKPATPANPSSRSSVAPPPPWPTSGFRLNPPSRGQAVQATPTPQPEEASSAQPATTQVRAANPARSAPEPPYAPPAEKQRPARGLKFSLPRRSPPPTSNPGLPAPAAQASAQVPPGWVPPPHPLQPKPAPLPAAPVPLSGPNHITPLGIEPTLRADQPVPGSIQTMQPPPTTRAPLLRPTARNIFLPAPLASKNQQTAQARDYTKVAAAILPGEQRQFPLPSPESPARQSNPLPPAAPPEEATPPLVWPTLPDNLPNRTVSARPGDVLTHPAKNRPIDLESESTAQARISPGSEITNNQGQHAAARVDPDQPAQPPPGSFQAAVTGAYWPELPDEPLDDYTAGDRYTPARLLEHLQRLEQEQRGE